MNNNTLLAHPDRSFGMIDTTTHDDRDARKGDVLDDDHNPRVDELMQELHNLGREEAGVDTEPGMARSTWMTMVLGDQRRGTQRVVTVSVCADGVGVLESPWDEVVTTGIVRMLESFSIPPDDLGA